MEFVGIAAAAAVLLGGLGVGLSGQGRAMAGAIVDGIHGAVEGAFGGDDRGASRRAMPKRPIHEMAALTIARERRWETSDDAPRVARSDLHMSPVLPSLSVWDRTKDGRHDGPGGTTATGSARVCLMCVDAGWRDGLDAGLSTSGTLDPAKGDFINADVRAEGRVALAGVDLIGIVQQRSGLVDWKLQGRGRATVGAEADGRLTGRVGRDGFELAAGGGAMAGAVIRGEARAGVDLLGVAVTTRGRAEGWAGAGVRANASVSRRGAVVTWDAGAGAALGLGGAVDWGGSVDTSKLAPKHRNVATATLAAAASVVLPGSSTFLRHLTHAKKGN